MDLRDQLASIAGPAVGPTVAEADADLARGRRALRRRRTVQTAGGSAFAAAALVAVFAVTTGIGAGPAPTDRGRTVATTQLVAYTGKQPKVFTIDKVPDGWFVQSEDDSGIVLAPSRIKGQPPVDPSTDPLHDPRSFVGKIAIMLQSRDQSGPGPGTEVRVGERRGVFVAPMPGDGDGTTLWIEQPNEIYLLIQFWQDFGLSRAQMIELGAGVHVPEGAKQGVG